MALIPIINEASVVIDGSSRSGDNDTPRSAQVAAMVKQTFLVLMTDVDSLYTGNLIQIQEPNAWSESRPLIVRLLIWPVEQARSLGQVVC